MEARVVREWSEPSTVTLAVILKCLFSYENMHTRVVREVVRLFKSPEIIIFGFSLFCGPFLGRCVAHFHADGS